MTTELKVIWDYHDQYLIRDVHEKLHKRVQNYMLENYFVPHRLYAKLKFQKDSRVNQQYLNYVEHILNDQCSIVVLHEQTDRICAVALVKCMTKKWHSWTSLKISIEQSKFSDILELQNHMISEFATENPDEPSDTLHIFEHFIESELKTDYEFLGKFFNAIYETARHFKMPLITFIAMSLFEQQECYDQGYEPVSRAVYSIYTHKNRRPFILLRDIDENEAILFVLDVLPLVPYYEMKVRGIDEIEQPRAEGKASVTTVSLPKKSLSVFASNPNYQN